MKKFKMLLLFRITSVIGLFGFLRRHKLHYGILLCGLIPGLSNCHSQKHMCYDVAPTDTTSIVQPKCYDMAEPPASDTSKPSPSAPAVPIKHEQNPFK